VPRRSAAQIRGFPRQAAHARVVRYPAGDALRRLPRQEATRASATTATRAPMRTSPRATPRRPLQTRVMFTDCAACSRPPAGAVAAPIELVRCALTVELRSPGAPPHPRRFLPRIRVRLARQQCRLALRGPQAAAADKFLARLDQNVLKPAIVIVQHDSCRTPSQFGLQARTREPLANRGAPSLSVTLINQGIASPSRPRVESAG
jgi:hypothetical protein